MNMLNKYHLQKPYMKKFFEVMGNSNRGARRVAMYLARNYTDMYVAVGK